ncbi:FAD linked oxidase-like protein [Metarhizium album ARSEF 1941]|uniref:FAD linked oxidase-like protein n=1 Tax=Metarhizium album (strain ARSEF 1941) TaxID=1081103 RepID=A0A0B2WJA0_METAS|nr:FAD linked oxidase-like protein [Metarhizium album ARSEF 1941]KHN96121.1 FAD linked oxidase-like protein [Metarhizium album ARSEF 1941]
MAQGPRSKRFPDFPPKGFKGRTLRPGDAGYTEARQIPNARYGNEPALIAQCLDAHDVVAAVEYCDAHSEPIAIRSGGHAIDGHAMPQDAFVIDTTLMKKIEVEPSTGITTVDAGVLLGEMDAATQKHGYVVPSGTVSATGAAGLTLGGGMGYLTRRFGMTVDSLLSVRVVTVKGDELVASREQNAELFWGLCGAGHNLAIATSFTYQAHKMGPDVISGLIIYRIDEAAGVLSQLDAIMRRAPRELTIYPVTLPAPPLPGLPEQMLGVPVLVLIIVYTGPPAAYHEAMAGVRALAAQPLADMVKPSSWLETNSILDVLAPPGRRQHTRGGYLSAITPEVASAIVRRVMKAPAPTSPGPSVAIAFPCLGGAIFDFAEDSTAYSRQGANWMWEVLAMWDTPDKDAEFERWVDAVMTALTPFSLSNGYVNLSVDRGPEWLRNLYGSPDKWARICALKTKFDPHNRLRHNKNIARARESLAAKSWPWPWPWTPTRAPTRAQTRTRLRTRTRAASWLLNIGCALSLLALCRVGLYLRPNWGLPLYLLKRLGFGGRAGGAAM